MGKDTGEDTQANWWQAGTGTDATRTAPRHIHMVACSTTEPPRRPSLRCTLHSFPSAQWVVGVSHTNYGRPEQSDQSNHKVFSAAPYTCHVINPRFMVCSREDTNLFGVVSRRASGVKRNVPNQNMQSYPLWKPLVNKAAAKSSTVYLYPTNFTKRRQATTHQPVGEHTDRPLGLHDWDFTATAVAKWSLGMCSHFPHCPGFKSGRFDSCEGVALMTYLVMPLPGQSVAVCDSARLEPQLIRYWKNTWYQVLSPNGKP